ncbi:MAG: S-layer family protein [Oscillatoria sp. PMC 1068.18]|nr:S-layer family protein [Oscillatoria sp. PMC 1076.18]MEC4988265.1 S-layer family protein [Oscillatoria sp. PMC 1068.18]
MLRQKLNFSFFKQKKLFFSLLTIANFHLLCCANLATAQLIPDRSLGEENSTVTRDNINGLPSEIINGGATRGTNLFHSFQEFNINQGRGVYFSNPANIENIFNRVTGNNVSNIFGTLGVLGNANLFLINPNGIIFGPNASLDLGGSFFGSTADSLVFNNDFEFSASNPEAPPLLTVNVPIGLRFRENPGNILVQGTGINRPKLDKNLSVAENELNFQQELLSNSQGLQVDLGETLALIGGEITLESGLLKAEAGNIELGSVGEGFVSLIPTDIGFTFGYEKVSDFRDIQLLQESGIFASGEGGGDIQIVGKNLLIREISEIQATTLGANPGGDMIIKTSDLVEVTSNILDEDFSTTIAAATLATGNAGDVKIETGQLQILDRGVVGVASFGEGNAGNLEIKADAIALNGNSFFTAQAQALGEAGDIIINTGQLQISDRATIEVATTGAGNAGTLLINAETIQMTDTASLVAGTISQGNAGNINIETQQLHLSGKAIVGVVTNGVGSAGVIAINAETVQMTGDSGLLALTFNQGNAGNVIIQTDLLILQDQASILAETFSNGTGGAIAITQAERVDLSEGSRISAGTFATGDAGNITIDTRQLLLRNGARVEVNTESDGKGGNIQVRGADFVELIGTSADEETYTGLVAATFGTGDAGRVSIETRRLVIRDGAAAGASVASIVDEAIPGDVPLVQAGTVNVIASESVEILGTSANGVYPSSLTVTTENIGDAGSIFVQTPKLIIGDRAQITATTSGSGTAGDIRLETESLVLFNNAEILGATFASGNAGDVNIQTQALTVQSNSQISVIGQGTGNPGSINVNATESLLLDSGELLAASELGKGGNITVSSPDIRLRNGSTISAIGGSAGNVSLEGNININTETLVLLEASSIITDAVSTQGGSNIVISPLNGDDLFVFQSPDSIINASGDLQIDTELDDESVEIVQSQDVDPNQEVTTNACQQGEGSEFVVTGRGGLPTNPNQALEAENISTSFIDPVAPNRATILEDEENVSVSSPTQKTPARGWVVNERGEVILVAYDPSTTPLQRHLVNPALCHQ